MQSSAVRTATRKMMNTPPTATENLVSSYLQRLLASINLTTSTAQLAAAELRLAISSAGLFIAGVVVLGIMLTSAWILVLITGFEILQLLGFHPAIASALMLLIQVAICVAITMLLLRLRANCQFQQTRQALRSTATQDNHSSKEAT